MANTIKQKRGTTDPGASDLVVGELAINTTDGGVFTKTDGGTVVEVGAGGASEINDLSDALTNNSGKTIGLGTGALANDDGGNDNTALGYNAGNSITSGTGNVAIGPSALSSLTTPSRNTAVGDEALSAYNSNQSAAFGGYAGRYATGANSTYIGYSAGEGVSGGTTGSYNTFVGEKSGEEIG